MAIKLAYRNQEVAGAGCDACGSDDIQIVFLGEGDDSHIACKCNSCKFTWRELPLFLRERADGQSQS